MAATVPTTIDQVIDKIRARIASSDTTRNGTFQLNIKTANKTSSWVGDLLAMTVIPGTISTPDIIVDMDEVDFLQIGDRTLSLTEALATDKVHISGNVLLVPTMAEVLLSL